MNNDINSMNVTIEEKLDFLDFRQDLIFYSNRFNRLMYETGVTRKQNGELLDLVEEYSNQIHNGEHVNKGSFEQRVYEIVPEKYGDYHFAEFIALDLWKDGRWEDVFESLYKDFPKYQNVKKDD